MIFFVENFVEKNKIFKNGKKLRSQKRRRNL